MTQNANGVVTEIPWNWILFCDEWLFAKMLVEANNKLMVYMSAENIYNTRLPMIGTDIVIARWDALNHVIGSGFTSAMHCVINTDPPIVKSAFSIASLSCSDNLSPCSMALSAIILTVSAYSAAC